MNISVNDLDKAYQQCESLNLLVSTKGEMMIANLESLITNLKFHWRGSDANTHIANLCNLHSHCSENSNSGDDLGIVPLVTLSKKITAAAADAMIDIQRVRKANGGSGNVGSALNNSAPKSQKMIPGAYTTEYYCDPKATTDLINLEQLTKDFASFKVTFIEEKNALMSNWTDGAGHEDAVKCFKSFEDNVAIYEGWLNGASEKLSIALSNISKLG